MSSHRRTIAAAAATILTSISLYPVFIGTAWFWAGAGAVLAVAGAATLTRLRRLPVLVCVVGTLAGLLLYLNLVFSNGRSWGHLLPTATSLGRASASPRSTLPRSPRCPGWCCSPLPALASPPCLPT
jgi:hypothetical protein